MSLVDGQGVQKKLLMAADVQALEPDFAVLTLIDEEVARAGQVIVWQREGMQLDLLTTNNFPAAVQEQVERFGHEGLVCDIYYVDMPGFGVAMEWYGQWQQQQADRAQAQRRSEQAAGQGALGLMQELYAQRQAMKAGDFVMDFVRLAYQAGASDLHLQAEQGGVYARVRIDGVLHEVVRFELADYGQYLAKLCFLAGLKLNITTLPQDGRFFICEQSVG